MCNMMEKNRLIYIRGNHEDLFEEILKRSTYQPYDISNGTIKTLASLQQPIPQPEFFVMFNFNDAVQHFDKRIVDIINKSVDFYEVGDYIFCHGWLPLTTSNLNVKKDWKNASKKEWYNARWINGMEAAANGAILKDKTICCGHFHTSYGHVQRRKDEILSREENQYPNADKFWRDQFQRKLLREEEFAEGADFSIFYDKGIIALDACAAHTGTLNILVLEEDNDGNVREIK